MTHTTEQERASLRAFIEMAEREGFDTAHQWYEAKGWVFFSPSTADCWRYWQAARRAPAVPVPQGWKLVPISPTQEQLRAGYWSGAGEIRLHEEWARKESYERMVQNAPMTSPAAAPQPPEADMGIPISQTNQQVEAPVQLPENLREGEPYDNPAFEALARALGVWGTAQSAVCAQFWIAAKEQST
ncbi:hypothetical protein [Comamonas jiangduensis]|uniref:hypothetical protein n=1 Tax=Comamonas jiangduensis TaxID=1194168 RepID=UPI0024E10761|nr:hypothetical protein [Comamonas jiangduensis]